MPFFSSGEMRFCKALIHVNRMIIAHVVFPKQPRRTDRLALCRKMVF